MTATVAAAITQSIDAVKVAAEEGRLDLVTAVLTIVAILLALGGIFAFFDVRRAARATANETAKEISADVAEKTAIAYLERELPKLIEAYQELAANAVKDDQANAIAEAQENQQ